MATPEQRTTFRFLTRFQCIADRCEDTCCHGLKVLLNRPDMERLEQKMSAAADTQIEFAAKVHLLPFAPAPQLTASIATRGDGACSFLEPTKRCSVVTRFEDATLPQSCALYPRSYRRVGNAMEVTASLACPEIARL